jgi:hypothetical protein
MAQPITFQTLPVDVGEPKKGHVYCQLFNLAKYAW